MGAFVTSLYSITNEDGHGTSPTVQAVLVVSDSPNFVELVLGNDLVGGALYQVSAIGVPATDLSVTGAESVTLARFGQSINRTNVEPRVNDQEFLLYGKDVVWNGQDFAEDANGDLFEIGGSTNARLALERRLLSEGLLWDPTYGAKPRYFVDGTVGAAGNLKGVLEKQATSDDRVKAVKTELLIDDSNPAQATFNVDITLVGGQKLETISVGVTV